MFKGKFQLPWFNDVQQSEEGHTNATIESQPESSKMEAARVLAEKKQALKSNKMILDSERNRIYLLKQNMKAKKQQAQARVTAEPAGQEPSSHAAPEETVQPLSTASPFISFNGKSTTPAAILPISDSLWSQSPFKASEENASTLPQWLSEAMLQI